METKFPPAPWLYLLEPDWQAWREWQYIKGNNPDPGLDIRLGQIGKWPPKANQSDLSLPAVKRQPVCPQCQGREDFDMSYKPGRAQQTPPSMLPLCQYLQSAMPRL